MIEITCMTSNGQHEAGLKIQLEQNHSKEKFPFQIVVSAHNGNNIFPIGNKIIIE